MINTIAVKRFCCEDISLIENYDKAINDNSQTWDCHHRLEIELSLSKQQLIDNSMYYNVPANHLIFLTKAEHARLHSIERWNDPNFRKTQTEILIEANKRQETRKHKSESKKGKHNSETHNKNISKAKKEFYSDHVERKKQSERLKGKHKDKCWMSNGIDQVFIKKDKIEYYSNRGYNFGRK